MCLRWGGIAQKYNCALKRLDWHGRSRALVSSLALGYNEVEIHGA